MEKLILEHKKKEMRELYAVESGTTDLLAQYQTQVTRPVSLGQCGWAAGLTGEGGCTGLAIRRC